MTVPVTYITDIDVIVACHRIRIGLRICFAVIDIVVIIQSYPGNSWLGDPVISGPVARISLAAVRISY